MELATVREAVNLTNKTSAITPYTLRQVLTGYATLEYVKKAIEEAAINAGDIDLSDYAKKTDIPTHLSQLKNDDDYVQTVDGVIPSSLLPSYVDDVLSYISIEEFPKPGDTGKIYVDTTTNLTYRWGGTDYIEISKSLALGTTASTAYRGDHGLIAYQHTSITGNPHSLTLGDLSITVSAETINYLSGLNENLLSALYKKLDTSGGVMTGFLTLHHDPVEKMHAANKFYVDTMIDGISVTVTQNVTRITEIAGDLESQKKLIGVQADTLTEVENSITGLNQTTADHTEAISAIEQSVSGISTTVGETKETLTVLEATINLIELSLAQYSIVIPVDKDNKPIASAQYKIRYDVKFRGNKTAPEHMGISGTTNGITFTYDADFLIIDVDSSTAIEKEQSEYVIRVDYTQTVLYEDTKVLTIVLVPKGEDGAQGKDGAPGTPGEDGKTYYTWIKYADSPTEGMSNNPDGKLYMGIAYNKTDMNESEDYNDYTWSLIKGEDGDPGKSAYEIWLDEGNTGTEEDYLNSLKGEDGISGIGISSIVEMYYPSTSPSELVDGEWSTDYPGWDNNTYIWTKTVFNYTEGEPKETDPICVTGPQGQTGMTGAAGTSITNVDVLYYQSEKPDTLEGGQWSTSVPVYDSSKYIWTKTRVHYTDAEANSWSEETAPVSVTGSKGATGDKGEDGKDGKSFSHIENWYAYGSDQTTAPSTGWSTTITTRPVGQYLWIKEKIFDSDGNHTWGTPYPVTGDKGDIGKGIKNVVNKYLATSASTGVTTGTSGWTENIQTITSDKKYLWNYEVLTYTDDTTSSTVPCIIGTYGTDGKPGSDGKGIKAITEYYLVSPNSSGITTSTSGWKTTMQLTDTTNKYLWNYEVITYTDNTTSTTTPIIIGTHGTQGPAGSTGTGIESITEQYFISDSKLTVPSQSDANWKDTCPAWSSGKYIWTRSKIVYKNPSSTAYTTPVVSSEWEAANSVQAVIDQRDANYNLKYSKNITIYGDANTFYPVIIKYGKQELKRTILVTRGYFETAPDTWNTATHKGALALKILTNFGGWGGANYSWELAEFEEMYSQLFGGCLLTQTCTAFAIFLRGGGTGGAVYHLYSDQQLDAVGTYDYALNESTGKYEWGKLPSPQIAYNSDVYFAYPNSDMTSLAYEYKAPAPRAMELNTTTNKYQRLPAQNEEIRVRQYVKLAQTTDTTVKKVVKVVDVQYYLSNKVNALEGGTWSTVAPTWTEGKYMWSRQVITYVDGTSEIRNATCIAGATGQPGKDAAVISATAPTDTTKVWLNVNDNKFYRYQENAWIPVSDVSEDLLNIREQLGKVDGSIKDAISNNNASLSNLYYTKEEVNTTVEQKKSELNIEFTNKVSTLESRAGNLEATVNDLSGYIHTGSANGATWLQLGNKASDFSVRIENSYLAIKYKDDIITKWEQDKFTVETVVSRRLTLGTVLGFVVNDDQSVSFRKIS